jgi:hypothetical protein
VTQCLICPTSSRSVVLNPSGLQVDAQSLFEVCNAYRAAYGRK